MSLKESEGDRDRCTAAVVRRHRLLKSELLSLSTL